MKIFSAAQVRDWDAYTISHEPIASIGLMERAAAKCVEWITTHYPETRSFSIFCGKGNNGGDGLAIARLLAGMQYKVTVHIIEFGFKGTAEFQENLKKLHVAGFTDIHFIQSEVHFPSFAEGEIIIDALFGTGLNRDLEGITAALVAHLNNSGRMIISIDVPTGLFTDRSAAKRICVHAGHTLAFQAYKLAFLVPENEAAVGNLHILDIGLHPGYAVSYEAQFETIDLPLARAIHKPRRKFAHKGDFGHALLVAGSYGKMGAALLAAHACMRSGVGLLTCHVPLCGHNIMQTALPEAMVETDASGTMNTALERIQGYNAIGIGPGLGTDPLTMGMLRKLLTKHKSPLVIDADALNIIAEKNLHAEIPPGSILTPHPREFERLFGKSTNDFERINLAMTKSKELNCIIVLKGHHSFIAAGEKGFFNTTGNAGMATAGSGDALSGVLTGLIAQGYGSLEASLLGVFLHGMAGDIAAKNSMESLIASDIIQSLGQAYKILLQ